MVKRQILVKTFGYAAGKNCKKQNKNYKDVLKLTVSIKQLISKLPIDCINL